MAIYDRLDAGLPVFGITATIADPFVGEVLASQPFDYIMIDAEHSPMSRNEIQMQLIAMRTSAASLLVRIAELSEVMIGTVLDLGADGVVVPHIESGEECAAVVAAAKYPPLGSRGVGPRRAARLTDRAVYYREANDRTIVIAMIESAQAVERIDDIVTVAGLDAVIIGLEDLAGTMGHLGNSGHDDVKQALATIISACNRAGTPFGIYAPSAAAGADLLSRGAKMISIGSDLIFFDRGLNATLESFASLREWRFEARDHSSQHVLEEITHD